MRVQQISRLQESLGVLTLTLNSRGHQKKTATNSKYISFEVVNDDTAVRRSTRLLSFDIFRGDEIPLF